MGDLTQFKQQSYCQIEMLDSEIKARQKFGEYYTDQLNDIGIKNTPYISLKIQAFLHNIQSL